MYQIDQILERAETVAKSRNTVSKLQAITFAAGCIEPGYDDNPTALGNWNNESTYENGKWTITDDTIGRVARILERMGYELHWSDEWVICEECGKCFRCQADSYGWQLYGVIDDGGCACAECIDPADHLESLENKPRKALTIDSIDPSEFGYIRINDSDYENGLYGGQCDDPKKIADSLRAQGIHRFIFRIESVGQFDLNFSAWIHESESAKLDSADIVSAGPDPAVAMQNALKDASAKMAQLPDGKGIKYARCNADGTADVRIVSPDEFIQGIQP
jgi:hypothetical protein